MYEATNPILVRYLRVVSDADPGPLAVTTWSSLIDGISVCVAGDDDDWLELAVGAARESAQAAASLRSAACPVPSRTPAAGTGTGPQPAPVDQGVAMLRACGSAVAEVLALGVVAGLGRDSIARITGQEPSAVLALVLEGQSSLVLPVDSLVATLRVPATPAEVADLPAVRRRFAAQSHSPLAADITTAASIAAGTTTAPTTGKPTVEDLLTWSSPAPATSRVVLRRNGHTDASSGLARIGAGTTAWAVAVAGVGAAVAMSGVIPAAIHRLLGDQGNRPAITAHGPVRPGDVPSPITPPGTNHRPSGDQPGPVRPATEPVDTALTGDRVVVSASAFRLGPSEQVVVVPAVLVESSSSPQSAPVSSPEPVPARFGRPSATRAKPTPQPGSGTRAVTGAGHAYGKGHAKHSTGLAKGRVKAAQRAARAAAQSVAKAQEASARAAAKAAARTPAKSAAAKARATAKAATTRAKAAKSRA